MFEDTKPNVVILGDSNTWAFGPAWVDALARKGWPRQQVVMRYRSGSSPRHWLPKSHRLHAAHFGALWERKGGGQPTIADAISPSTRMVMIGLGGNMIPGSRDNPAADALVELVARLAPAARIVWRGPPPSTATPSGKVASRATKAGRYRRNGMLKQRLTPLGFSVFNERATRAQERLYLDMLALHAGGPAPRLQPLAVGRDEDLAAEQAIVASLRGDRWAQAEEAQRGPWTSFVRARDGMHSHVPRDAAADFVALMARRNLLDLSRRPLPLPLAATVVDPDARVRGGPPQFRWKTGERLAQGRRLTVKTWKGRHAEVADAATHEALGWTLRANLDIVCKSQWG